MTDERRFFGGVEAGGTKFVCAVGDERGKIHADVRFPTTDPISTLGKVRAFLEEHSSRFGKLAGIGVGSFGPVELDRTGARYGFIGPTPKPGWSGTDIVGTLARAFSCPIGFDTDVNAAALAEHRWGSARDVKNLVYVTIGTGIGGGVIVDGAPIHGLMHPEIGHIYPRRHALDLAFDGVCPFHGDCLEGVASGPAILARTGASLQQLDEAHPQWEIEADYLGQLCAQLVVTLSPQRIVMGGGVMSQARLLPLVRRRMQRWLGGYIDRDQLLAGIDRYVVPPELGVHAGVLGALALAMDAAASISGREA
ncbi:MAG TPA: ROK family protein [Steroidobacteraceae bacterium]|nr:ROK family protein [Steroidobacteraceae bacterium]